MNAADAIRRNFTTADFLAAIEYNPDLINGLGSLAHAALRAHSISTECCGTCSYLYYDACRLKCKPDGKKCNCYRRGRGD